MDAEALGDVTQALVGQTTVKDRHVSPIDKRATYCCGASGKLGKS